MDEENVSYSNMMDENGKIIISDNMPDDLKMAINYLNENNVNLNSKIEEYDLDDDLDDDLIDDVDNDLDDNLTDDEDNDLDDDLDDSKVEGESSNLDDLNSLF